MLLITLVSLMSCAKKEEPAEKQPGTSQKVEGTKTKDKSVFERIPSQESGIDFVNKLEDRIDTRENLFDYDFFYNGSGVGIADLNNDGLDDIFFTANQEKNRLYVNKGDLKFEDITETSGINAKKKWSSGVTFADVNNDGYLDIYVCQGGPFEDRLVFCLCSLHLLRGTWLLLCWFLFLHAGHQTDQRDEKH